MKILKDLLKRMGITSLWYVGIFLVCMIILQIIFARTGVNIGITIEIISESSTRIFMLVMGVVSPLVYFNHYIGVGVTRKQFFFGIMGAGAVLSVCYALLIVPVSIYYGDFSMIGVLRSAVLGVFYFVLGQTAVVGFQYMRTVLAVSGIICAAVLLNLTVKYEQFNLPPWIDMPIMVLVILGVGALLFKAVRGIPIRC